MLNREKERKKEDMPDHGHVFVFIEKNEAICACAQKWSDEKKERTAHELESV
jgi:hypothetical protein